MTELTLNKTPLRKTFSDLDTIESVITHIFDAELEKENIITDILIDGELIPFEDGLDIAQKPINMFQNINFKTQTSIELAFEALDSCNEYVQILVDKIMDLTQLFQAGRNEEANELFGEVIDILDLFIQLFSRIHSTIKRNFQQENNSSEDIQKLEIHLLSILKALLPAKEKNDLIMLCDLLEYELVDNLTQWKIKIIPMLKAYQA